MKISYGVTMLEITTAIMGGPTTIYPVLLKDQDNCLLVDTGYPGETSLQLLTHSLTESGVSPAALTGVILTHQDLDHIGGLPGLRAQNDALKVWAHTLEKPYVEGEKKLVKISKDITDGLNQMPEHIKKALMHVFENPPTSAVNETLADGEVLPICGGITVIHTPGHTPGHICLYLSDSKTLIAGDALTAKDGTLFGPVPEHATDIVQSRESLKKLLSYDIERVVCYHGGLIKCGAERIEEIVKAE